MPIDATTKLVDRQAAELREQHRTAVLANRPRPVSLWERPCRAYNVHIHLSFEAREALRRVQARLAAAEPTLLRVPPEAMHVSVSWLLAVHAEYSTAKDRLWTRYGREWTNELRRIAAEISPFALRYRRVVATESAVIALASPPSVVNDVRHRIATELTLPPQTRNRAHLVHTTLCRYGGTLSDPAHLLAMVGAECLDVSSEVRDLVISRERVYPSLKTDVLARLPLG